MCCAWIGRDCVGFESLVFHSHSQPLGSGHLQGVFLVEKLAQC